MMEKVSPASVRDWFPALEGPTVFMENAGGSQVPRTVADRAARYFRETYVQLGAGYPLSRRCETVVDGAHQFARRFFGGSGPAILGSSSSALCRMLAEAYARVLHPGDEIVLAENGHEANIGPWLRLEDHGLHVRWWRVDPHAGDCTIETLEDALTERTVLVAFPHVSNLLGGIAPIEEIAARVHAIGARVVVDGVAYAPHRALDVDAWETDWYVFSTYKTYGPHMAALYGRSECLGGLTGPNHFFIPDGEIPYKFELGGVSHEGCAALLGTEDYFRFLGGDAGDGERISREAVLEAGRRMTELELPLQEAVVSHLRENEDVQLVGPDRTDASRVPTISFRHARASSAEVTRRIQEHGIAVRHGHMYSYRLCRALGIDPEDGVVRISLVHYNSEEEVDRLLRVLRDTL